jgi:hypothetical protein
MMKASHDQLTLEALAHELDRLKRRVTELEEMNIRKGKKPKPPEPQYATLDVSPQIAHMLGLKT